jgi:hypothetical protein
MDPVWYGIEEQLQELPRRLSVLRLDQLRHRELTRSINGYEKIRSSTRFGGTDPNRTIAYPLQHRPPAQRAGMQTTDPKKRHPDGSEATHTLTLNRTVRWGQPGLRCQKGKAHE